jgi:translation initiation factor IF-3
LGAVYSYFIKKATKTTNILAQNSKECYILPYVIRLFYTYLSTKVRVNHQIQAPELRVIGDDGTNYGVISREEAMRLAADASLDLIEISPTAIPPVAKIMDFGKYQYDDNKKAKIAKAKAHVIEVKNVQVKVGTGDHDLALKAKRASEWLAEGHRVKIDLFLPGRTKYMEFNFLKERLDRVLKLITVDYNIADAPKKSPKAASQPSSKENNMKTNKSFAKRLKVTRTGKIIARKTGQNHFNAKESGRSQIAKKRGVSFTANNKIKSRYLINI